MTDEIKNMLESSTLETFGEMAFLDVLPAKGESILVPYTNIFYMDFLEPLRGALYCFLPMELKKIMVENIYGEDWESLTDRNIDDCLLETMDVLGGNFLTKVFKGTKEYKMSIPSLLFDDSHIPKNIFRYAYETEGLNFIIGIRWEKDE